MKKIITYLLLFTFSTMLLKPAMPYVTDVLAHSFWYANHMATVHFENGKYHVHKEVIDTEKESNQEKNTTLLKSFYSQDIFIASSWLVIPIIFGCRSTNSLCNTFSTMQYIQVVIFVLQGFNNC